jgi:DNA topoisomerase-2
MDKSQSRSSNHRTTNYKQDTDLEHVISKPGMYVGSIKRQETQIYVIDKETGKFVLRKIRFTPGWYKIIDEVLVNAMDHWIKFPNLVSKIHIEIDSAGMITITNNGPGISLKMFETVDKKVIHLPEAIASAFRMGDNLDPDRDRITGGTHGLGLKLTNAYSDFLQLSTVVEEESGTGAGRKKYTQIFRNRLSEINPPEITDTREEQHTRIQFMPSYKNLGYKSTTLSQKNIEEMMSLVEARAYQAAIFTEGRVSVYFNGRQINVEKATEPSINGSCSSLVEFSRMFLSSSREVYHLTLKSKKKVGYFNLDWDVCIGISDGKFRQVSIINGIYVYSGGNHIRHLKNLIVENIQKKVIKELGKSNKFNKNYIINNLFIIFRGFVKNPSFNSQIKNELDNPQQEFEEYVIPRSEWSGIWSFLKPHIINQFLEKKSDKKTRIRRTRIILSDGKAFDALFAGHKTKAKKTSLILGEGDSAIGIIINGINHPKTDLSLDFYGYYSLQGVPINARKECKVYKKDGESNNIVKVIRNEKLQNNKRMNDLVMLLGLDYTKTYDAKTDKGRRELATLRYGQLIIAVDQDKDGKGNILGLVLNNIALFWPKLIEQSYVKRFNTPIIRAYNKKKSSDVLEFYYENVYKQWIANTPLSKVANYRIKYYKGLGSHDYKQGEVLRMFTNFDQKLIKYTSDQESFQDLEIYFGKKADLRKKVLGSQVDPLDEQKLYKYEKIPVSLVLKTDVKEFQLDNILRKIPHILDGMVPSRRKVLYAAQQIFRGGRTAESIKTCDFTGMVSSKTHYHHGDASLSETIIKMCQTFPGARNLPMLIGLGQFGSRNHGGKDSASARYTFVKLNSDLCWAMFPREDLYLLEYEFDDGYRCEPRYYVSVLPLVALESLEIPATGWKCKLWAREPSCVIKNVRNMIESISAGVEQPKCSPMKIWMRDNSSEIRVWNNKLYAVGKYKYDKALNRIYIQELPPGVFDESYVKSILFTTKRTKPGAAPTIREEFTGDYVVKSNYDEEKNKYNIHIWFDLAEGALQIIQQKYNSDKKIPHDGTYPFDHFEEFMNLKVVINSNINVGMPNGGICEYKKYTQLVEFWFQHRKNLYAKRHERMIIITKLTIKYYENIIRFCNEKDKYGITSKTTEKQFENILAKNNYTKFNKTLLFNPEYTPIPEIVDRVLGKYPGTESQATYNYISNLTFRQLLKEANEPRKQKLLDEKNKLKKLQADSDPKFPGKNMWLEEITNLEKIIHKGIKYGW